MLATESSVNAYEYNVNMERSCTPYQPLTQSSRMHFDAGLAQLQEIFPEHPPEDLLFVLKNANGDVSQASTNILAKSTVSPTKPNYSHQVLEQFTDLFPRETLCAHSPSNTVSTLASPRVTPLVNHCGQFCRTLKGPKLKLYRMWWPKACFPAHKPMPTNALQLQRDHTYWENFSSSVDSPASSISGTPGATPHRQSSKPEAESIAVLPEFLQQLISPAADNKNRVGQQGSSLASNSEQEQVCKARQQIAQDFSQLDLTPQSSNSELPWAISPDNPPTPAKHSAPLFPDDDKPADANKKLEHLKDCFRSLPDHILANTLCENGYGVEAASNACLSLITMQDGVPDWSSESDLDSASIGTDSVAATESPMHANKTAKYWPPDESEELQNTDFDKKLHKLSQQFSYVSEAIVQHHLSAAEGNYDMAVSMLYELLDASRGQEAERQRREAEDLAMATKLQQQMNSSATSGNDSGHAKIQSSWSSPSSAEASDPFDVEHPEMKDNLNELRSQYPSLALDSLQNILVMANGSVKAASQIIKEQGLSLPPVNTQAGPGPSRLQRESTMHSRPQWPSIGGEDVPVSPPPGLEARAPRAVPYGKEKALHVARRNGHSDIYTDARKSFREAQAKMHSCRQAFHNAQAAGDSAGQRHYASQLEYWQHKALQEKQRAHKKIFTKKNAEVSNDFKVDLHALHVDEALSSLEDAIVDLQRFKCTWMVEVITGKGLHSVGKDPKLLPAVRQYLGDRGFHWWDAPGKVVFKIAPEEDQDY